MARSSAQGGADTQGEYPMVELTAEQRLDRSAENFVDVLGEAMEDALHDHAMETWRGVDDWLDLEGDALVEGERHMDRTYAALVRALVPKLLAAAEVAERRATDPENYRDYFGRLGLM